MVKIVMGCMTFGQEGKEQSRVHSLDECQKILDVFKKHGHVELDTARYVWRIPSVTSMADSASPCLASECTAAVPAKSTCDK